ncbi:ParB N-terminal domain-containing protein [Erythrobacter sp.]|uniref:DNA methyltransferase n=1 Tax=Erythrobacter sp. TaxID=1042 RepID=UPI0025D7D2F7|nr:ParB N-terminal domain-containing protein [Erythrobacter sp.]
MTTPIVKPALTKQLNGKSVRRRKQNAEAVRVNEAIVSGGRNDLLPDCKIEFLSVGDLKPAKRRTRKLTNDQLERVIQSIKRNGFVGAILIRDGRIVDGHVRLEAAKQLGLSKIPCITIEHLTEDETRVLALSMSRIAETGEWDLGELKLEMGELIELNFDLSATGFSAQEQDIILLDPAAAEAEEEEVPVPPAEPVARLGDTFLLDKHRIHCGDATKAESYSHALDGQVATACLTDPPYNVKIENNVSGLGKHKHGEFVMASGEMTDSEFKKFLEEFLGHCSTALIDRGALFAFIDWRSSHVLINAGLAVGLKLINLAVWDKGAGGMGAFYRSAHELIPIFCKGSSPAINNIQLGRHGRDRCNIFRYTSAPGAA